jgi:hypothetical protein
VTCAVTCTPVDVAVSEALAEVLGPEVSLLRPNPRQVEQEPRPAQQPQRATSATTGVSTLAIFSPENDGEQGAPSQQETRSGQTSGSAPIFLGARVTTGQPDEITVLASAHELDADPTAADVATLQKLIVFGGGSGSSSSARPPARRGAWAPVARRRDGLLGLAATAFRQSVLFSC